MKIIIFLQISEYNSETDEYCKNKTNIFLPSQYSIPFLVINDEVVYNMVSIKIHVGEDVDSGHY